MKDCKMKSLMFRVTGQPVAKARPRMARRGKAVWAYTPKTTKEYEELVASSFVKKYKKFKPIEGPVSVEALIMLNAPAYVLKLWKRGAYPHHTKKPDIDNIMKSILDALNGVAWLSDSQVVEMRAAKGYSETPEAVVTIKTLDSETK